MTSPFFDSPYHPLRAFLLSRLTYLLLAGDLWLGMVQHGGRYGLGAFNVAHFALFDVLLPVDSPRPYVALLMLSGCLALALGLFSQPRWLRATLALTYTLAWMISIHDSYQHHYFLSWLLAWLVAFPDTTLRAWTDADRVQGWGLPMSCLTCAIVYSYTGVAKSEAAWRRGDVLRALAGEQAPSWGELTPLHELLTRWGVDDTMLWGAFAYATIALQWTIALGYVLAVRRDGAPSRWRTWLVSAGLLGAISFHVSAEAFGHFEIGVFSYYMLGLAIALLAPLPVLTPIGRVLASARQHVLPWLRNLSGSESPLRLALLLALVAAVGASSPLPGALPASLAFAAIAGLRMVRAADAQTVRPLALQTAFCALTFWLVLTQSSVSFDYYRRVAGELRNMGQPARALESYRMAERYAPRGHSRAREIRELERELSAN